MNYKLIKWITVAVITVCITGIMTSCDIDNSDTTSEDYRQRLADTTWQLSEVMNEYNEWMDKNLVSDFDIPHLSLGSNGRYEISIYNYLGSNSTNTLRGRYSISDGIIYLYDDVSGETSVQMNVKYLSDDMLEAFITIFGNYNISSLQGGGTTISQDLSHHTVRFKRK